MMLWYSMNQTFLFSDSKKKQYITRIVGKDAIEFFKSAGLAGMEVDDSKTEEMRKTLEENPGASGMEKITKDGEKVLMKPRFPVNIGTKEEPKIVPKLKLDEFGGGGDLYVEPTDLKGNYDFIADVEAMALNTEDTIKGSRQQAITLLVTNPNLLQLLSQEGIKPKFKDLFVSWLEDSGFKDADKYFETVPSTSQGGAQAGGIPMAPPSIAQAAGRQLPNAPQPNVPQQNGQGVPGQLPNIPNIPGNF